MLISISTVIDIDWLVVSFFLDHFRANKPFQIKL